MLQKVNIMENDLQDKLKSDIKETLDIVPNFDMLTGVGYDLLDMLLNDAEESNATHKNYRYLLVDLSNYFIYFTENENSDLLINKIFIELVVGEGIGEEIEDLLGNNNEWDDSYEVFAGVEGHFNYQFYLEMKQWQIDIKEKDVKNILSNNLNIIKDLNNYLDNLTGKNSVMITSWIGNNALILWREY